MSDEISSVSPIAVDRTNRDHPRREPPNQQSRRQPPKPTGAPAADPTTEDSKDEEHPVVGSRLNVRA